MMSYPKIHSVHSHKRSTYLQFVNETGCKVGFNENKSIRVLGYVKLVSCLEN